MAITPNSEVHFLNVPLENNYKNQIYFPKDGKSIQTNYMKNHVAKNTKTGEDLSYYDLTYVRKDNVLKVPTHIDELYSANYVMYKNTAYSDRWFYAFITNMRYVNDGLTEVAIETDVWQTWFDKITIKDSFVEREHVPKSKDIIGAYRQDEELETGDYIVHDVYTPPQLIEDLNKWGVVISTTMSPTDNHVAGIYNGIVSGTKYYIFDTSLYYGEDIQSEADKLERMESDISSFIARITENSDIDGITGVFIVPRFLYEQNVNIDTFLYNNNSVFSCYIMNSYEARKVNDIYAYAPSSLNGYTPRNKKLMTFPYRQLFVSNNNGGSAVYNYEDFITYEDFLPFSLEGAITPGCSIRLVPKGYLTGTDKENNEHGINLGKFPICNYSVDMYTHWITQNAGHVALDLAQGMYNLASSSIGSLHYNHHQNVTRTNKNIYVNESISKDFNQSTDNLGRMGGSMFDIARTIEKTHVASIQPYQARGNLNSGDVTFSAGRNTFTFYHMCIREEFAKIIDSFFDMFGYKINQVKTPNFSSRSRWNYIKTNNVNLDGNVPQDDLRTIRLMFDNGVTFWKHTATIEDYSNPETNV